MEEGDQEDQEYEQNQREGERDEEEEGIAEQLYKHQQFQPSQASHSQFSEPEYLQSFQNNHGEQNETHQNEDLDSRLPTYFGKFQRGRGNRGNFQTQRGFSHRGHNRGRFQRGSHRGDYNSHQNYRRGSENVGKWQPKTGEDLPQSSNPNPSNLRVLYPPIPIPNDGQSMKGEEGTYKRHGSNEWRGSNRKRGRWKQEMEADAMSGEKLWRPSFMEDPWKDLRKPRESGSKSEVGEGRKEESSGEQKDPNEIELED